MDYYHSVMDKLQDNGLNKWDFDEFGVKALSVFCLDKKDLKSEKEKEFRCWMRAKDGNLNLQKIKMTDPEDNFACLHPYACLFKIEFMFLEKYFSKDDDPLYFFDNPVTKDHLYGLPMIHASSWKGNLHWVCLKNFVNKYSLDVDNQNDTGLKDKIFEDRIRLIYLFGTEQKSVSSYLNSLFLSKGFSLEDFQQKIQDVSQGRFKEEIVVRGSLSFYSSFFDKLDYAVINPHDRVTRAGLSKTGPIIYEVIPEKTSGELTFLYLPFHVIGSEQDDCKKIIVQDLSIIEQGIISLLEKYGISAKRKAGFGKARINSIKLISRLEELIKSLSLFGQYSVTLDGGGVQGGTPI